MVKSDEGHCSQNLSQQINVLQMGLFGVQVSDFRHWFSTTQIATNMMEHKWDNEKLPH